MKHLHQLPNRSKIDLIRKIHEGAVKVSIKEDGVAVTVGITAGGSPYVSREGKEGTGSRYFRSLDVPDAPQYDGIHAAAQIWFSPIGQMLRQTAVYGDRWNVEVTYPDLNVIEHKTAKLTILYSLPNERDGQTSTEINFWSLPSMPLEFRRRFSYDGRGFGTESTTIEATIRPKRMLRVPSVAHVIDELENPFDGGSVEDVLLVNLNQIPKADRAGIKTLRSYFERRIARTIEHISMPSDCEGIVIDNGTELVKIVPSTFVEQNQFDHAVRNCIRRRTFATDFPKMLPSIPTTLIETIDRLWKTSDRCMLVASIGELRKHYLMAQAQGLLKGPGGQKRYKHHVHNQTLVEFASFLNQLQS